MSEHNFSKIWVFPVVSFGCNFAVEFDYMIMNRPNILRWKAIHKWLGLMMTIFLLSFCVSGIILNHREAVSGINVNRSILPSGYKIAKYNNGSVKGTIRIGNDSILAYGNVGIWLTNPDLSYFSDYNTGLPDGMDSRNVKNIVQTPDGELWCATNFDLYRNVNGRWDKLPLPANEERISDLTLDKDSTGIVVLTRSALYTLPIGDGDGKDSAPNISIHLLKAPDGYTPRMTLFKTIWQLHSGELFGTFGRIVVDLLAVVIAFLCITGLIIFIMPPYLRNAVKKGFQARPGKRLMKWSVKWHNNIGYYTIALTLIIAFTGMCLRPPLMIPFVMLKTAPVPGSNLDSNNPWHDKLRAIRWDSHNGKWLVSTSEGFYNIDKDFEDKPTMVKGTTPPVSPMGITVFDEEAPGEWIIGSFSGIYRWNMKENAVTDYSTGKVHFEEKQGRPVSNTLVSGFSKDLNTIAPTIFDYRRGAEGFPENEIINRQPMSLWNAALELHVGRCYDTFLGPFSELFVFLSGLLFIIVLISGLIVIQRQKQKSINNNNQNKVSQ